MIVPPASSRVEESYKIFYDSLTLEIENLNKTNSQIKNSRITQAINNSSYQN